MHVPDAEKRIEKRTVREASGPAAPAAGGDETAPTPSAAATPAAPTGQEA
ncbi:MAG: hypothetical protein M3P93_16140 [Actinomycetota bacterium]|nr:hypothetical protein [Actinomycetota bacterium]